jgi:hypothetical protein
MSHPRQVGKWEEEDVDHTAHSTQYTHRTTKPYPWAPSGISQ